MLGEEAVRASSIGHVTRLQPIRLQHFWWWYNTGSRLLYRL